MNERLVAPRQEPQIKNKTTTQRQINYHACRRMKALDLTLPTPAENLACDEALLEMAESGQGGEVLRFWESPQPFVVVGYANKVATEVNVPACEGLNIPILRRCSGGGTVVQGPGCLNYALILSISENGPTRNISTANQFVMERNRSTLEKLYRSNGKSASVTVSGHTDLAIEGAKFSGNAQRRRKHYLLFHGTFLLHFDLPLVSKLLHPPSLQPEYRAKREHGEFIRNLNLSSDAIKAAFTKSWQGTETVGEIPQKEIAKLVAERYSKPEWNLKF